MKASLVTFPLAIAATLALAVIPQTATVRLSWEWDTNIVVDEFHIFGSVSMSVPLTNWGIMARVPGNTNSTIITMAPGKMFFYATASNLWGETGPSNVTNTPMSPTDINTLKISR